MSRQPISISLPSRPGICPLCLGEIMELGFGYFHLRPAAKGCRGQVVGNDYMPDDADFEAVDAYQGQSPRPLHWR